MIELKRPIIFGEILFDCFPDGREVLGGAPFNVAWHLSGFGLKPLMVSRVGIDKRGEQVLAAMSRWGMETVGIETDKENPTGVVQVTAVDGEPTFEIKDCQAYDFIEAEKIRTPQSISHYSLMYHGSLALRRETSLSTLEKFKEDFSLPVFVDLNLRTPWCNDRLIRRIGLSATWMKLNEDELKVFSRIIGEETSDIFQLAQTTLTTCQLESLIVTRGDKGALIVAQAQTPVEVQPTQCSNLVDSVGAGDAFSAVCIVGMELGWSWPVTLTRAARFAALICSIRGATTFDTSMYQRQLEEWGRDDAG